MQVVHCTEEGKILMDPSEVVRDISMLAHADPFQALSSKFGIYW